MKRILLLITCLWALQLNAQEVRCNLTVNTEQITGGSVQLDILESFERQVREFINDRRWTNDIIKDNEKIEFSMLINIRESDGNGNFKAQTQIQSVRPIYGSSYNSAIFSFKDDDFTFSFSQMDVLNFNIQNASQSNLTALLAYYTYLIIGYDYDTFSKNGGKPYFQKANDIALQMQNTGNTGWQPLQNDKNRYWIVQNLIQPRYNKIHDCLYTYHREGMDQMTVNPDLARKKITQALKNLEAIYDDVPDLINMQIFFNAKSQEIIGIYKEASADEKKEIIALLDRIYPSNTQNWSKINQR